MLQRVFPSLNQCRNVLFRQFRRNLGATAVVSQKAAAQVDPIQQLFLEKIREYSKKSKESGGGMVEATAEEKKSLENDLDKVARQYGADGPDFTNFPTFTFADSELEPVGVQVESKQEVAEELETSDIAEEQEDKPYWQA